MDPNARLVCRNCVGQNFANVSMLTFLATLLGRFSFRLAKQARPATSGGLIMSVAGSQLAPLQGGTHAMKVFQMPWEHSLIGPHQHAAMVQMGGAEEVRRREVFTVVTSTHGGMWLHAVPRA